MASFRLQMCWWERLFFKNRQLPAARWQDNLRRTPKALQERWPGLSTVSSTRAPYLPISLRQKRSLARCYLPVPQPPVTHFLSHPLASTHRMILRRFDAVIETAFKAFLLAAILHLVPSRVDCQHRLEIRLEFRFGCRFDTDSWLFSAFRSVTPYRLPLML